MNRKLQNLSMAYAIVLWDAKRSLLLSHNDRFRMCKTIVFRSKSDRFLIVHQARVQYAHQPNVQFVHQANVWLWDSLIRQLLFLLAEDYNFQACYGILYHIFSFKGTFFFFSDRKVGCFCKNTLKNLAFGQILNKECY